MDYKQEALGAIIEALENEYDGYLCELHHSVFNEDYWQTYTPQAIDALEDYEDGIFGAIEKIKQYEQQNFGEVNTDFSNPCNVANMLWYIIGEELMTEIEILNDNEYWGKNVDEEYRETALKILNEMLDK